MQLEVIARIISPFDEKFALPRQAGLLSFRTIIRFEPPFNRLVAVEGLDKFSHCWIIFGFHHHQQKNHKKLPLMVRPPRLGGNQKLGVFASRSPFRPNPLGLSQVKIERIIHKQGELLLFVEGGDMVNGTPVYDIKPYLGYADCIIDANSSFAKHKPQAKKQVIFTEQAEHDLKLSKIRAKFDRFHIGDPIDFIRSTLAFDPRPAYRQERADQRVYGVRLCGLNIRFCYQGDQIVVLELEHSLD